SRKPREKDMAKITVRPRDEARRVAPDGDAKGAVETFAYLDGENDPIHLFLHKLSPGAELTVTAEPSDLSVYVWSGSVDAGKARLDRKSSAVVERGASQPLRAASEGAELLVFHRRQHGGEVD